MYSKKVKPNWASLYISDIENRPKYKLREWQKEKRYNVLRKQMLHDIFIPLGNANPNFMFTMGWFGWFTLDVVITSKPQIGAAINALVDTGYWKTTPETELRVLNGYAQQTLVATPKLQRYAKQFCPDDNLGYNLRIEVTFYPDEAGTCKIVHLGKTLQTHERDVYSMECAGGAALWERT